MTTLPQVSLNLSVLTVIFYIYCQNGTANDEEYEFANCVNFIERKPLHKCVDITTATTTTTTTTNLPHLGLGLVC